MALVNDGERWHIRCFDHNSGMFKDYNLARFKKVNDIGPTSARIDDDADWQTIVALELTPHPNASHPETIQFDFDMDSNVIKVELPRCVAGYFLRRWHIDFSANAEANPRSHQLYLVNRLELLEQGIQEWALEWDQSG